MARAWHEWTPWDLNRTRSEWVVAWAVLAHVPLTMTLRDGLRFWLRYRLAQRQTETALAYVLDHDDAPHAPDDFDQLLREAVEIGKLTPAYSNDPKPDGERPARKVATR